MTKAKIPSSQERRPAPDVTKMAVDAYSPPAGDRAGEDIADVVCRIMDDDGPRPMARLKPTKKTPNAADQFDAEHQQPYEAYGARSRDRLDAVRAHNTGYPRMHDELNKKRSTAKVTMSFAQRNGISQRSAYNRCSACGKTKKRVCPKRRGHPSRYVPREARRRVGPRRASITKPKARARTYEQQRIPKLRSRRILPYPKLVVEKGTLTCRDLVTESKDKSNSSQYSEDRSSKRKNPDTDASVSSYNSYASLEHEPMVAN